MSFVQGRKTETVITCSIQIKHVICLMERHAANQNCCICEKHGNKNFPQTGGYAICSRQRHGPQI